MENIQSNSSLITYIRFQQRLTLRKVVCFSAVFVTIWRVGDGDERVINEAITYCITTFKPHNDCDPFIKLRIILEETAVVKMLGWSDKSGISALSEVVLVQFPVWGCSISLIYNADVYEFHVCLI